jgi:methylenetetrahydrofolate dehydrogenase (NADP+)/methenyltetrahydrofolate cyclohydrolase
MTVILDGKKIAMQIRASLSTDIKKLNKKNIFPMLALVVVTEDESALSYVSSIEKAAEKVGVRTKILNFGPNATFKEISGGLRELSNDPMVHGIILQTPLPKGINEDELHSLIAFKKDVDGANPLSLGRLVSGLPTFAPATAVAVMEILKEYKISLPGTRAVMVGRSRVVGKPLAHLLLDAHATVTICHSKTKNLYDVTKEAELLIVAIGKPLFIDNTYIKKGAVVIDVGTNVEDNGALVGDVDSEKAKGVAGYLSPVPGGVGPVTTSVLLKQTVLAAKNLLN